ncbi:MAG: class I SAM-dependent methyltransferase [Planctomycetes bacterium]|nr:class I SAM-dependent methyltransferase [Planctomycetota bacterium]
MTTRSAPSAVEADLMLAEDVEGWMSREELALLHELAARVPRVQCVVEIGNYRGRSTVALALGARHGSGADVYSVDPHAEFTGPRGGHFGREDMAHLYANLARSGVGAHVRVVTLPSVSVARAWTGPRVGLLFVDGDHRYEAVRADYEAWRPSLAPGAVIAFDDCDFAEVVRFVEERVDAGELVPQGGAGKVRWFGIRQTA